MGSLELMGLAERRWNDVRHERPDLERAIELQRTLVRHIVTTLETLERRSPPLARMSPDAAVNRLSQGVPALQGESVPLPVAVLGPLLTTVCDELERGGAGPAARHIREALDEGRIESGSLMAASLSRNQRAIRAGAARLGLAEDLLWLVAELAAGPAAYLLQASLADPNGAARETTPSGRRMQEAIEAWGRGYCWLCGSWPALAEIDQTLRRLRCSFCSAAWRLRADGCIYCGEAGQAFVDMAIDPARPGRRLETCGSCRGYLKALEVSGATPFPLLPIEDLASSDLDEAAMKAGYCRPPLPDLGLAVAGRSP